MSKSFFRHLEDALIGFLPRELRSFSSQVGSRNLKIWFDPEPREHFEAQLISPAALRAGGRRARRDVLEVGFHAEHRDPDRNDAVVQRLIANESSWRRALGTGAETGRFLGRQSSWRRISEVWDDVGDPGEETAVEAAERLAAYVRILQPLRSEAAAVGRRAGPQ
jgi:hypothetical protein